MTDAFRTYALPDLEHGSFEELLASARFEDVGKGRRGAVLVRTDGDVVPIVRTTTSYRLPAQVFRAIHAQLADQIRRSVESSLDFNNGLIEHYTHAYATMGSHSDQALDLAEDSVIAVFSAYKRPEDPSRQLCVEPKSAEGATFAIPLPHHHVVAFSVGANRHFKHKIVLRANARDNEWLGITFRTSKTHVRFVGEQPCFQDGTRLTLASDEQLQEFLQLRRRENKETDFTYPRIDYTISESDLRSPT
jgi:hypothetical protein